MPLPGPPILLSVQAQQSKGGVEEEDNEKLPMGMVRKPNKVLPSSKVDGFVPRTHYVNFWIVREQFKNV